MSVGTQWDLVHSTQLEEWPNSMLEGGEPRPQRCEPGSHQNEQLGAARGISVGALLGSIAWLAIFASGFAIRSLLFG